MLRIERPIGSTPAVKPPYNVEIVTAAKKKRASSPVLACSIVVQTVAIPTVTNGMP
jgi:hypothetical protein